MHFSNLGPLWQLAEFYVARHTWQMKWKVPALSAVHVTLPAGSTGASSVNSGPEKLSPGGH